MHTGLGCDCICKGIEVRACARVMCVCVVCVHAWCVCAWCVCVCVCVRAWCMCVFQHYDRSTLIYAPIPLKNTFNSS